MLCSKTGLLLQTLPRSTLKHTYIHTVEIKFLGIQITDTLKWHSHVQLLAGKLCKVTFMIKSL